MPYLKDSIVVTDSLLNLLEVLYRYKYVRTPYIPALTNSGYWGTYKQLINRREQGFITNEPSESRWSYNSNFDYDIYTYTDKGEQLLREHGRIPQQLTRLKRGKTDAPSNEFAHSMMICDTMASIEMGLRKTDCEIIHWDEILERVGSDSNLLKLPFSIKLDSKRLDSYLVPDGLFGIRYPGGQVSFFALEAQNFSSLNKDRKNRSSTSKKLLSYHDVIKRKTYKQLGISNLRVLFVYGTTERMQNAIELAEEVYTSTNAFLFNVVPLQQTLLKNPPPFPRLFTDPWYRAGKEPIPLYQP